MLRIHKKCNFFANENIHFFFFFKTEFPYLGARREELKIMGSGKRGWGGR